MIRAWLLVLMLLVQVPEPSSAQDTHRPDLFVRMGAYIASDDLARSEEFYSKLFGRAPVVRLEAFVAFDVGGGWFAVVSRAHYAADAVPGSGAVPYVEVLDLEEMRDRAVRISGADVSDIIVEPGISLLKVIDPDGQLIEFYAL
ncbi:MAG: VOC family protein [Paracoccaceae bacterium]